LTHEEQGQTSRMALIVTRAVDAEWRPARRFWAAFQVYDPAAIMPIRRRSAIAADSLRSVFERLLQSQPRDHHELAEKLKVFACVGLSNCAAKTQQGPFTDADDVRTIKAYLVEAMSYPASFFLHSYCALSASGDLDQIGIELNRTRLEKLILITRIAFSLTSERCARAMEIDAAAFGIAPKRQPADASCTVFEA
jgi:hypothetical protein